MAMREKVLDFWFDFASTYSYPAAQRIGPLAAQARVKVRFRPFLLGPIFLAQGWESSPFNLYEAKGRNMWRDLERLCADLDLPFRRPEVFPQQSVLAARVALVGLKLEEKWGKHFCLELFRAEFGDGKRIDDPAVIGEILTRLKVDPGPVLDAARSDALRVGLRIETEEAQRLGIFGAPTFITPDGEMFWGNDRLERALAWAKKPGKPFVPAKAGTKRKKR
jgi:2-hydroxychromene-2-carboxylate isomerase